MDQNDIINIIKPLLLKGTSINIYDQYRSITSYHIYDILGGDLVELDEKLGEIFGLSYFVDDGSLRNIIDSKIYDYFAIYIDISEFKLNKRKEIFNKIINE